MTDTIMISAMLAVLGIGVFLLYRFGCVKEAKAILLHLVAEAEARWGGGTGEIKFSEVSARLYEKLPMAARYVLSEKAIAALIEHAVEQLKGVLSEKTKKEQT